MPILKTSLLEVPVEEAAAKLAVLQCTGIGVNKCVQLLSEEFQYNFTRTQVKRLEMKDSYVKTKEEYHKNVVKKAVAELKQSTSRLVPKIISALEQALDKGNIQAVLPSLKILGIDNVETEQKQAQTIQVILPGKRERDVNES